MQVGAVDQPGHQRSGLLRIPAPVAAPGDVRPDRTEDDHDGEHRERDDDSLVAQLVEHFLLRPALPLDVRRKQVHHGSTERDDGRAVGQRRGEHVHGQQRAVLQRRHQRVGLVRQGGRVDQHAEDDRQHDQRQRPHPVAPLEVDLRQDHAPRERDGELVVVGEGRMPGGEHPDDHRPGERQQRQLDELAAEPGEPPASGRCRLGRCRRTGCDVLVVLPGPTDQHGLTRHGLLLQASGENRDHIGAQSEGDQGGGGHQQGL